MLKVRYQGAITKIAWKVIDLGPSKQELELSTSLRSLHEVG